MKLFECQHCGQLLYFENTRCESCGRRLGYLPARETVTRGRAGRRALARARPRRTARYKLLRQCRARRLQLADRRQARRMKFCAACRHNRTIPDLDIRRTWRAGARSKPPSTGCSTPSSSCGCRWSTRTEDPEDGLAFDFLVEPTRRRPAIAAPVMTGHANGLITLNIAEADDVERERQRTQMGEPIGRCSATSGTRSRTISGIV